VTVSRFTILAAVLLVLLSSAPASAIHLGGQLVYGDDADLAIGGRVEIDTPELVEDSRIEVDFNWYFPDDPPGADLTFWEANLNWLHQVGPDGGETAASYYLGGGLNFAYSSIDFDAGGDDSEKDLGVNLLGGVQLPLGPLTGIGELRITIAGSEQYTLGVGLLF
jgi:hypothetical protein